MDISYDPAKDARNVTLRRLSFARAADFGWADADIMEDVRNAYPERRFVAVGYLDGRLHILCFTPTDGVYPGHQFPQGQCERGKEVWQSADH